MLFFHFWPVSSSSQCWLSQLTHQILHNNIGRTRRQQSVPTILTQTVGRRRFEGRASRLERRESRVARGLKGLEKQAIIWSTIFFNRTGGTFLGNYFRAILYASWALLATRRQKMKCFCWSGMCHTYHSQQLFKRTFPPCLGGSLMRFGISL